MSLCLSPQRCCFMPFCCSAATLVCLEVALAGSLCALPCLCYYSAGPGSTPALLAWRTGLGGLSAYTANSGTMILGFPEWIVFACMAPPFVLTSLIALGQVFIGFDESLGETA